MEKRYIVRLSDEERGILNCVIAKLKGTSQKVRRAHILLKTDADGPAWIDRRIADAFGCRRQTIENIRQKFVLEGFDAALNRKKRTTPSVLKLLDGKQEVQLIAMRLGDPPKGFSNWSLRLLADRVVALEVVQSISHETVRRTLKKTV